MFTLFVKDLVAFFALVLSLSIFVFYFPNALGEPDNYLEADPYSTPAHTNFFQDYKNSKQIVYLKYTSALF